MGYVVNNAEALEAYAASSQQREFLERYLAEVALTGAAKVLEIGCGTGAVSRRVARWPGVAQVHALDQNAELLQYARAFSSSYENLTFIQGDARRLPLAASSYDVVLLHCVLYELDEVQAVLSEAFRVLNPGGLLLLFEPDFASLSYSLEEGDPLEAVGRAVALQQARNPYQTRALGASVRREGFRITKERSYVHLGGSYLLELFEGGAQHMLYKGLLGAALADGLINELRRRVALGLYSGSLNYLSLQAVKPEADLAAGI